MDGDDFDPRSARFGLEGLPEWFVINFANAKNEMGNWAGKRSVSPWSFYDFVNRGISDIPSGDSSIGGFVSLCWFTGIHPLAKSKRIGDRKVDSINFR